MAQYMEYIYLMYHYSWNFPILDSQLTAKLAATRLNTMLKRWAVKIIRAITLIILKYLLRYDYSSKSLKYLLLLLILSNRTILVRTVIMISTASY